MTFAPFQRNRNLIPRWRPVAKALGMQELAIPGADRSKSEISAELSARLEAWRAKPTIVTASEAVETALVENHVAEAVRPARTLIQPASTAAHLVKRQARLLLARAGYNEEAEEVFLDVNFVKRARTKTRLMPRDVFAWADLALAHLSKGNPLAAHKAILVALQLAPNNRLVLRAAARLYLHVGDPERSHDLLVRAEATKHDPWLMAAEIAIAPLADRNPRLFKAGRWFIEQGGVQPRHISELASAIATVHLREGHRKARSFFRESLIDPTGNALAQAESVMPQMQDLVSAKLIDRVQDSAEAKVFKDYWAAKFKEVLTGCWAWHVDECYSTRPHLFGSSAAITIEDFPTALKFADEGLKLAMAENVELEKEKEDVAEEELGREVNDKKENPNLAALHNNRAFALVALGRLDEARSVLTKALVRYPEETIGPLIATMGLVLLRGGQIAEGEEYYRRAISFFKRNGNRGSEIIASAYFAQEMARAGAQDAARIVNEAKEASKNLKHRPEVPVVLGRADGWLGAIAHRRANTLTA